MIELLFDLITASIAFNKLLKTFKLKILENSETVVRMYTENMILIIQLKNIEIYKIFLYFLLYEGPLWKNSSLITIISFPLTLTSPRISHKIWKPNLLLPETRGKKITLPCYLVKAELSPLLTIRYITLTYFLRTTKIACWAPTLSSYLKIPQFQAQNATELQYIFES